MDEQQRIRVVFPKSFGDPEWAGKSEWVDDVDPISPNLYEDLAMQLDTPVANFTQANMQAHTSEETGNLIVSAKPVYG